MKLLPEMVHAGAELSCEVLIWYSTDMIKENTINCNRCGFDRARPTWIRHGYSNARPADHSMSGPFIRLIGTTCLKCRQGI